MLNYTYNATIKDVPMNKATKSTYDINPLLLFKFWEPIYFIHDDSDFHHRSIEERRFFFEYMKVVDIRSSLRF